MAEKRQRWPGGQHALYGMIEPVAFGHQQRGSRAIGPGPLSRVEPPGNRRLCFPVPSLQDGEGCSPVLGHVTARHAFGMPSKRLYRRRAP